MYSPALSESMIKTLYRLKRTQHRPMTVVLESLLLEAMAAVDKKSVCEVCVKENNNDCGGCHFTRIKQKETSYVEQTKF